LIASLLFCPLALLILSLLTFNVAVSHFRFGEHFTNDFQIKVLACE
jgi:hypothetical protein